MLDFNELTEQKISEKYEYLPQDLKNVLSSINTSVAIENIAAKYRLDEEKTTMLIQLVGLAVLGFVSFENMKEEMKETIDISPQFISIIADEIRQKIFLPVKDSMQKIMAMAPSIPPTPAAPTIPTTPVIPVVPPTPTSVPSSKFQVPSVDKYREPTIGPEVIDLRKMPPAVSPSTSSGSRMELRDKVEPPPAPAKPIMPPTPITPPLTFTRPIQPPEPPKPAPITPLIEAEPHKIPASTLPILPPTPSERQNRGSSISQPNPKDLGEIGTRPQYIMRPSGAPPTDLPDNVLDLRKDKGEF